MAAGVDAAEARQMQGSLRRRAVDRELRDELARYQFAGPHYQRFETELARYGMSVLRGWMYTGYVFRLAAARGLRVHPSEAELEELHRDSDVREELATMTVAVALGRFRERALLGEGWRFEGGASLATYFMGACLYVFPNEFRKHRAHSRKWNQAQLRDASTVEPDDRPTADPETIVLGNTRVCEDLACLDKRTKAIVALTLDGYSQEEIVELLGEQSVRAVEGVLYRWRTQQKEELEGGADHG